jgi:hypothetical protein
VRGWIVMGGNVGFRKIQPGTHRVPADRASRAEGPQELSDDELMAFADPVEGVSNVQAPAAGDGVEARKITLRARALQLGSQCRPISGRFP